MFEKKQARKVCCGWRKGEGMLSHLPEILLFFSKLKEYNYYDKSFRIMWLDQSKFLVV